MKKKIFNIALAALALSVMPSCMEVDNFDGPDSSIRGTIIDDTTGQPFLGARGETSIRIWEMSYSEANITHRNSFDLTILEDGSYQNTKLFKGTYDMLCRQGPWWPNDTVYDVKITPSGTTQDFHVVPYLKIIDFEYELIDETTLRMSCRLQCPYPDGREVLGEYMEMPDVKEVRPFINNTQFCGAGNRIDYYYTNTYRKNVSKPFNAIASPDDPNVSKETYTFDLPVKKGYKYTIRMGANCKDEFESWNYSPCAEIVIPQ